MATQTKKKNTIPNFTGKQTPVNVDMTINVIPAASQLSHIVKSVGKTVNNIDDKAVDIAKGIGSFLFNTFIYDDKKKKLFPSGYIHTAMEDMKSTEDYAKGKISKDEYIKKTTKNITPLFGIVAPLTEVKNATRLPYHILEQAQKAQSKELFKSTAPRLPVRLGAVDAAKEVEFANKFDTYYEYLKGLRKEGLYSSTMDAVKNSGKSLEEFFKQAIRGRFAPSSMESAIFKGNLAEKNKGLFTKLGEAVLEVFNDRAIMK